MTKNLSKIPHPKLLLFGGTYSNLQALESLMEFAENENIPPEAVINTGDAVAYCAQPEEVVAKIREWGIHSIAGNVEIQLRDGGTDCGCNFEEGGRCADFSKNWYAFLQIHISEKSIEWMQSLPKHLAFEFGGQKCAVVHGSFFDVSEYVYRSTPWERKQRNFEATGADIIIAGHAGIPFAQAENGKLWLNAGVIGMPANDGTERVWCATLEIQNGEVVHQFHALDFNRDYTHDLMLRQHLPDAYAETLYSGLWDNNEILPEEETKGQGEAIRF